MTSVELPFNFEDWTVEETCQYLQQEGLGKWADTFREISGDKLRDCTDAVLKEEMGIEGDNDRQKILDCIRKLWQITGKVFNDPIHGHVELHPLLIKIIDTPQFQRLRYIKQLGGAYFVYPGASHNRFEHSIGVGHLAGQLVEALRTRQPRLQITDRDILCVQIAGLCHDLGHGPFSHLFDGIFIPKARPGFKWKHETACLAMFDHMVKKNSLEQVMRQYGLVLSEDLAFIKEMIGGPLNTDINAAQGQRETWPYKGRTKDKSFLYEIVANKRNGIDVDKFDYFVRDCHHLGIQNNFDYHRFLKFARVCEVDGQKHICTRDKEVANLYDMFHTRNCLHRRAYQHKVNKIIEIMIAEAFLKADKHIQIEGSERKMFTLSTAIDDMEAYTKVTDHVFEQILYSSHPQLAEAKEILQDIISRKHCRFLGQTKIEKPTEEMICCWKEELARALHQGDAQDATLIAEDFEISVITLDYGMKDKDPINNMYFYSKHDYTKASKISKDKVSKLLPTCFSEHLIRVYSKKTDKQSVDAAKKIFLEWCKKMGFPKPEDGDAVTETELNPEENVQNNQSEVLEDGDQN